MPMQSLFYLWMKGFILCTLVHNYDLNWNNLHYVRHWSTTCNINIKSSLSSYCINSKTRWNIWVLSMLKFVQSTKTFQDKAKWLSHVAVSTTCMHLRITASNVAGQFSHYCCNHYSSNEDKCCIIQEQATNITCTKYNSEILPVIVLCVYNQNTLSFIIYVVICTLTCTCTVIIRYKCDMYYYTCIV